VKLPTLAQIRQEVAKVRKAAIAGVAVVGQVVALGVLHGTALHYAEGILAAAAAVGVYVVPNATKPTPP
jgi:hypothetical protein